MNTKFKSKRLVNKINLSFINSFGMKNIFAITKFCLLLTFCLCISNCKKRKEQPIDKSNIVLYNKPLSVIKECLKGKWELIYGKGGFSANTIQFYHDNFWEFNNDNVKIVDSGSIITDTTIHWIYNEGTYTYGDYTYIMSFHDRVGYIYDYVVDSILNDTLILHEDASDAVFYHFIKF